MPLLTITARIHAEAETERVLRDAMFCATTVYNGRRWHLRRPYEETGHGDIRLSHLHRLLAVLPRAKGYYSMAVQLTRNAVRPAWLSFFTLRRNGRTHHKAPGFRPRSMLSPLTYVQSGFTLEGDRLTLSLGERREDGIRRVTFRISHRPHLEYERVRAISIIDAKTSGCLEARLVVEVRPRENQGTGRVAVDLGETVLLAAAFDDGTALLYAGRLIKAIRRSWQKVRSRVKPLSKERPRMSRRYREIAHRERRQVAHLLHIITAHFIRECVRRGIGEIAIGDLTGIRDHMDYGARLNQRLHAWPYRKVTRMLRDKAALVGIAVRDVDERETSRACHACGRAREASRIHRVCTAARAGGRGKRM